MPDVLFVMPDVLFVMPDVLGHLVGHGIAGRGRQ